MTWKGSKFAVCGACGKRGAYANYSRIANIDFSDVRCRYCGSRRTVTGSEDWRGLDIEAAELTKEEVG